MSQGYEARLITRRAKELLMAKLYSKGLFERKASIHGACVKFFTDDQSFKEMWEENFDPMPDSIRPHARIFAVSGPVFRVLYEPLSKTVIIEGCDYYGWVKSIALALVADFFEDFTSEHRRYSVHGSFVDCSGRGLAIIGPSGSGKTTLTYGLLQEKRFSFLTDDWFFVRLMDGDTIVHSAEKNSYIRDDLARSWPCYKRKLDGVKKDAKGRSVVDVKRLLGSDRARSSSVLRLTVLLTRDESLPPLARMSGPEAMSFMIKNDFCNPHQLIRGKSKLDTRKRFFRELFARAPVYLLNTTETPSGSLERLKKLSEQVL